MSDNDGAFGEHWRATHAESLDAIHRYRAQSNNEEANRRRDRIRELEAELAAYDADFLFEVRVARVNESLAVGLNAALELAIEDLAALTHIPAATLAIRYRAKQQQGFAEHAEAVWTPGVELTVKQSLEQIAQINGSNVQTLQRLLDRVGEQSIRASSDELEAINGLNRVLHDELAAQARGDEPGASLRGLGTAAYNAVRAVKSTRLADVIPWAKSVLETIKQNA